MGVRGLSTFIDNNQKLLSHHRLRDTKVVIDGNNLYHFLFYHYRVSHQYGGDYDHYARKCKRFFTLLRKCGVEPIIVFDGGYDPDDRKLPTILTRMRDRRGFAEQICSTGHGTILPILASEAFRQVLVELEILHLSCDFEADDDIAILANDLDCPVMSNDSDFFVYDLKAGYIPLDYINLTLCVYDTETAEECICTLDKELKQSEYMYIPVKFYHRDKFIDIFQNKGTYVIPLLATLLGNDYLDTSDLSGFYSKLPIPKTSRKFFFSPKTQTRLATVIHWLNDTSGLDPCVEFVIAQIRNDKQDKVKTEIYKSVQSYSRTSKYTSVNLRSLLESLNSKKNSTAMHEQVISDYHGNQLPYWFTERLRKCEIHSLVQNIAVLHRIILLCQVEMLSEISTFRCSERLRKVTYGMILQSGSSTETEGSHDNCVEEYDRDQKNTKKMYIAPAESIPQFGTLPPLADIPELSVDDRQLLLLSALSLSKEDYATCKESGLQSDLILLIGVLSYWINNANPQVTTAHLDSLIVSLVILHVKVLEWIEQRKLLGLEFLEPNLYPQITETFYKSNDKQIQRLGKNLEKYFVKPNHSAKNPRDNAVVHGFSQFQACMQDTIHLNQLLLCPFSPPQPSLIINSTFMYNLCREMQVRPSPALFLTVMLDKNSPLCQLFDLLKKQVLHLCNDSCFLEKLQRKKKKKNQPKQKEESVEDEEFIPADKEEKKAKLEIQANCSVNNRFAMLDLSD